MDPATLILAAIFAVTIVRMLWLAVESIAAVIKGVEPPRMARKRAREELARRLGLPTPGQAVSEWLVRQIEKDREHPILAAMRRAVVTVVVDCFDDSRTWWERGQEFRVEVRRQKHAAKMREQRAAATTSAPQPFVPTPAAAPDPSPFDRPCTSCGAEGEWWPDDLCDDCAPLVPDPDPIRVPEPPPIVVDAPAPPTPPTGRKMLMSTLYTIAADARDPRTSLQAAKSSHDALLGVQGLLDGWSHNLARQGLGADLCGEVNAVADACGLEVLVARRQIVEYASHAHAQLDLSADPDLRATLQGYMSLNNA